MRINNLSYQQATQPAQLLRLSIVTVVCYLLVNLLTGTVANLKISDSVPGPTVVDGRDSQFPQLISQTAAAFMAGQYSSATNVTSHALGNNQTVVQLGNEKLVPPRWSGQWQNFGMFSSETLQLREPFNAIKTDWQALVPQSTQLEVDVRASQDGQNWTLWSILTGSGQVATFDQSRLYLFTQYRVRMFSALDGVSPSFNGINLLANSQDLNSFNPNQLNPNSATLAAPSAATTPPPTYQILGTREGMVGYRTANGHLIKQRDRFVSLPSWQALNDNGKTDYMVKITAPNGRTALAPVWDTGPWNFHDNYWMPDRTEFKDLPIGVPQAEKAFFDNHNKGLNENGVKIGNPSGIDVGDGTWWDDLGLSGASLGWKDRLAVTFMWMGTVPSPAGISNVQALNVGSGTATIQWTTTTPTNDWVEFGFDTNFGLKSNPGNGMSTTHSVFLYDLAPDRVYNFRVKGKDVFGQEVTSDGFSFHTGTGMQTMLTPWQNDGGLQVEIAPDLETVRVAGTRINPTYWSDNPTDDYSAGASSVAGNAGNSGGLDVEVAPDCDNDGQNCSFGSGSGFKFYTQLMNDSGENVKIGFINDQTLSPNGLTVMVEGKNKSGPIFKYLQPNLLAGNTAHHLHLVWRDNQVFVTVNYTIAVGSFPITTSGVKWVFAGAGRYKGDKVTVNYCDINFSWGSVVPPPPPAPVASK